MKKNKECSTDLKNCRDNKEETQDIPDLLSKFSPDLDETDSMFMAEFIEGLVSKNN